MAAAQWYWVLNGERQGPLQTDEIRQLVVTGRITPDTLVWKRGMAEWSPVSTVDDLAPTQPPATAPEPAAPARPGEKDLAPWGRRIAAKALDVLVIDLVAKVCLRMLEWTGTDVPAQSEPGFETAALLSFALVYWVYNVVGEAGRHRATLGKQLAGLQVIGMDGLPMGPGRIVIRSLAQIALFPGLLLGPLHPRRQCAHDLMVGSLVVQRRPPSRDEKAAR